MFKFYLNHVFAPNPKGSLHSIFFATIKVTTMLNNLKYPVVYLSKFLANALPHGRIGASESFKTNLKKAINLDELI